MIVNSSHAFSCSPIVPDEELTQVKKIVRDDTDREAQQLVQGVDVKINAPPAPREARDTCGMTTQHQGNADASGMKRLIWRTTVIQIPRVIPSLTWSS